MNINYETRHIFMAIAIGIFTLTPFLLLPLPTWIANSLYHTPTTWFVFVSGKSYVLYGIGFLFLCLSSFILFIFNISKTSRYMSIASLLLSAFFFVTAAQNYTSLADDSISFRQMFSSEKYTYSWDQVEKVFYQQVPQGKGFHKYEFHFDDGNKVILPENGVVRLMNKIISRRLKTEGIEIERRSS